MEVGKRRLQLCCSCVFAVFLLWSSQFSVLSTKEGYPYNTPIHNTSPRGEATAVKNITLSSIRERKQTTTTRRHGSSIGTSPSESHTQTSPSPHNFVYDYFADVLLVVGTTPKHLSSLPRARAALEPYFRHIVFTRGSDNSDLPAHVQQADDEDGRADSINNGTAVGGDTPSSDSGLQRRQPDYCRKGGNATGQRVVADLIVDWARSCGGPEEAHGGGGLDRCLCFPKDALCTEAAPTTASTIKGRYESNAALSDRVSAWRRRPYAALHEAFAGAVLKRQNSTQTPPSPRHLAAEAADSLVKETWIPSVSMRLERRGCERYTQKEHIELTVPSARLCSETVVSVTTPLDAPAPAHRNVTRSEEKFHEKLRQAAMLGLQRRRSTREARVNARLVATDPLQAWTSKILPALHEERAETQAYTDTLDEFDIALKGPGHRQMGLAQNLAGTEIMARVMTLERLAAAGHLSYFLKASSRNQGANDSTADSRLEAATPSTPQTPPLSVVRRFAPWLWPGGPCSPLTGPFSATKDDESVAKAEPRAVPLPLPALRGVLVLADDIVLFPWDLALRGLRKDVPWMMPAAVGANPRLFQYMDTVRAAHAAAGRSAPSEKQRREPRPAPPLEATSLLPPPRMPECTPDVVSNVLLPLPFTDAGPLDSPPTAAIQRRAQQHVDRLLVRGTGRLGPLYTYWRAQTVQSSEQAALVLPLPAGAPPITRRSSAIAPRVPYRTWNNVNSGLLRSSIGLASFGIRGSPYPDLQCTEVRHRGTALGGDGNRTDASDGLVEAVAVGMARDDAQACDTEHDDPTAGPQRSAVVCAVPTTQNTLHAMPTMATEMNAVADAAANVLCALARRGSARHGMEAGAAPTIEAYYRQQLKISPPSALASDRNTAAQEQHFGLDTTALRVALASAADGDGGRSSADGVFRMTLPPFTGPEVAEAAAETPLQQFAETFNFGADPSLLLQDVTRALQRRTAGDKASGTRREDDEDEALQPMLPVPVPADALASTFFLSIPDAYYVPRPLWGGMILLADLLAAAGPGAVHHEVGTPTLLRWLAAARQRRQRLEQQQQQQDQQRALSSHLSESSGAVDRRRVWRRKGAVLRSAHPATFEALHVAFAFFQPTADGCERPPGLMVCPRAPAAAPAHLQARLSHKQEDMREKGPETFAEGWAVRVPTTKGRPASAKKKRENQIVEEAPSWPGDPLAPATLSGYHRCRLDHPFQALLRRRIALPSTAVMHALLRPRPHDKPLHRDPSTATAVRCGGEGTVAAAGVIRAYAAMGCDMNGPSTYHSANDSDNYTPAAVLTDGSRRNQHTISRDHKVSHNMSNANMTDADERLLGPGWRDSHREAATPRYLTRLIRRHAGLWKDASTSSGKGFT